MKALLSRAVLPLLAALRLSGAGGDWPQFRGPQGDGQAASGRLPVTFHARENVTWEAVIPGTGWSSPVTWDGDMWMATALDEGRSLRAVAVDRRTGKIRHEVEVFAVAAPDPIHRLNSHASPTPVIEPGRVYFFFGRYGAACLDTATGRVLWRNTDLPHGHGGNGPGSSPILQGRLLILNCDGTDERYVTALDKATGRRVWTTPRSNTPQLAGKPGDLKKAYHTPGVIRVGQRDELISMGAFRVSGFDPADGRELWWVDIPGFSNVTRPVYAHGLVFLATGFMKPEFWAIRPGGTGDVTATHVAWKMTRQAPQKPSPVVVDDAVYLVSESGILTCLDARTGEVRYTERVGGDFSASPLAAGGRIYLFDQDGVATVVRAGPKFERLARNELGDGFMASPAVAGDTLFLRSKTRLYRIEAGRPGPAR
ncbi:MAG: PQQ-binding-like beta-propeller repeat protein [Verrucomicrobiota bacterium]